MNEFLNRILDLIEEIAFDAKRIESKITADAKPILLHLIKILKYEDPLNYKKHIYDINEWIENINLDKCKSKISYKKFYKWMYLDWIETDKQFAKACKILKYKYDELKIIRGDKEIHILIQKIMDIIAKQIFTDKFEDLESILKELNIFDEEQYNYSLKQKK